MNLFRRIAALFRSSRLDREMDAEMRVHLEHETEQNIVRGLSPDEARCAARRAFGGVDQLKEREREARGVRWIENAWRDLRHAARSLRRSPGFTAVVMVSLALGIGAGTSIFSVLNAVLLRALPVHAPHELRVVHWVGRGEIHGGFSGSQEQTRGGLNTSSSFPFPVYREFRDKCTGLSEFFAFHALPRVTAQSEGEIETAPGLMVSGNFFAGYGADALIGRTLTPQDDEAGAEPAVVITHRMWERHYSLDPSVLGQTLRLNQHMFTVVGVLPRGFVGPLPMDSAEFYVPLAAQPALAPSRPLAAVNRWWVQVMARVAPGTSELQIQQALTVLFQQVLSTSNTKLESAGIVLHDGSAGAGLALRHRFARPLFALLATVGLVLAIACANVAGLLLARGAARQHDFAVRAAMGAGRGRLIAQSMAESLLLGLLASVAGLLFAHWGKMILMQTLGGGSGLFRLDVRTDVRVLAFALGMGVLTALVFGLLPALRAARVDPLQGLKSHGATGAPTLRAGKVLVAMQVGLSTLLVVGAGLMVRTLTNLARVDPGFDPDNVLLFRIDPGQAGYKGAPLSSFLGDVRSSLSAIPGVRSVALSTLPLVSDSSEGNDIELPGRPAGPGESRSVKMLVVSDGFLGTMGIPLVRGRDLAPSDTAESTPVTVVNETFVRTYFPGEDALGRTFVLQDGRGRAYTIVGVYRDTKYENLRDAVPPVTCFSQQQLERSATFVAVRSVLPPLALVPAARKAIAALNARVPLSAVSSQEILLEQSISRERLFAGMGTVLAALGLFLSCIGLYGLMSYNIARRTSEIGVRMALGATRGRIAWPILREAVLLTAAGLGVGLPAALAVAQLIKSQFYEVSPLDPLTLASAAVMLTAVAIVAAWLPARRAAKVDPMLALRAE